MIKNGNKCCSPERYLYDMHNTQIDGFKLDIEYRSCMCRF